MDENQIQAYLRPILSVKSDQSRINSEKAHRTASKTNSSNSQASEENEEWENEALEAETETLDAIRGKPTSGRKQLGVAGVACR